MRDKLFEQEIVEELIKRGVEAELPAKRDQITHSLGIHIAAVLPEQRNGGPLAQLRSDVEHLNEILDPVVDGRLPLHVWLDRAATLIEFKYNGTAQWLRRLVRESMYGRYFPAPQRDEVVHTNLLRVKAYPENVFVAEARFTDGKKAFDELRRHGTGFPGAWLLREGRIFSFHDLDDTVLKHLCEGDPDAIETTHWSESDDEDERRVFVHLMGRTLSEVLYPRKVSYCSKKRHYYFRTVRYPGDDGEWVQEERKVRFRNKRRKSRRTVVFDRREKYNQGWEHAAVETRFLSIGDEWYVSLTPTYRFTTDGRALHRLHEEFLKQKQQREFNESILSQVLLWSDVLGGETFESDAPALIEFESRPLSLEHTRGIHDSAWTRPEPDEVADDDDTGGEA